MTATAPQQSKVTYTSANVDWELFHRQFDDALARVRAQLGRDYPLYIGRDAVASGGPPIVDRSPIDTSTTLGRFATATPEQVGRAVAAAKTAQRDWAHRSWRERVATLRQAAGLIRERKFELAAIMALEVGKSRLESMEDANGFVRQMAKVTAVERNTDALRPYGVFACIAPFNFPLALSTGMSAAALVAGNAVVYKPAEEAPWTGLKLYEVYRDAGLPAGVFNYLPGSGEVAGETLWRHSGVDGVVFTGSKAVGMHIFQGLSRDWIKPCLLEMGGKNAAIVLDSADLDAAAEGVTRSSFGLQNQKCSATSRVYVHQRVAQPFVEKLVQRTKALKLGDPTERDVVFGPVINAAAVERFRRAAARARREGKIVLGGQQLGGEPFDHGHYVAPTIAELPLSSSLFREELFVPFLAVGEVSGLEEAIVEVNKVEYGLTAGIFSKKAEEIERFFDEVDAGVCYVNKRTGATTGAWPGAQPFCGWKGSGSTGKGGCGPYYVAQFLREQSRTVIEESR